MSLRERIEQYLAWNENPTFEPCHRCDGKGYHHGFGEGGHDPDHCDHCGGPGEIPTEPGRWDPEDLLRETVVLLVEGTTPPTCATCRWFQSTPATPGQPATGSDICTKEPAEWPMHWRETWPTFGCNGWEAQS